MSPDTSTATPSLHSELIDFGGEYRFKVGDQWYYRGNRHPMWLAVASRADGSCQGGISEQLSEEFWPLLDEIARLKSAPSETREKRLAHHLQQAIRFITHTEAFGKIAESGILQAGQDKTTAFNVDDAKAVLSAAPEQRNNPALSGRTEENTGRHPGFLDGDAAERRVGIQSHVESAEVAPVAAYFVPSAVAEIMGRQEIAARLRALADFPDPWKLGDDPNVAWRVACRQAADFFDALERNGIPSSARFAMWGLKVENIVNRFQPMQPFDNNQAVAQYNDLLDLARRMAALLDKPADRCPRNYPECNTVGRCMEPTRVNVPMSECPFAQSASGFRCKAQPTGVVPSDCDWPNCGCDPHFDRVVRGLQESGWTVAPPDSGVRQ